jgi:hypothetical protein
MYVLCATDKTNAAHSITMRINCLFRCFNHFWMRRKSKVVVGAKI